MAITMTAPQAQIIAAESKKVQWLFYVKDSSDNAYYWSTQDIPAGGASGLIAFNIAKVFAAGLWFSNNTIDAQNYDTNKLIDSVFAGLVNNYKFNTEFSNWVINNINNLD